MGAVLSSFWRSGRSGQVGQSGQGSGQAVGSGRSGGVAEGGGDLVGRRHGQDGHRGCRGGDPARRANGDRQERGPWEVAAVGAVNGDEIVYLIRSDSDKPY